MEAVAEEAEEKNEAIAQTKQTKKCMAFIERLLKSLHWIQIQVRSLSPIMNKTDGLVTCWGWHH